MSNSTFTKDDQAAQSMGIDEVVQRSRWSYLKNTYTIFIVITAGLTAAQLLAPRDQQTAATWILPAIFFSLFFFVYRQYLKGILPDRLVAQKLDKLHYVLLVFSFVPLLILYTQDFRFPLLTIGDQIRDGPLTAMTALDGQLRSFFAASVLYGQLDLYSYFQVFFEWLDFTGPARYRITTTLLTLATAAISFTAMNRLFGLIPAITGTVVFLGTPLILFQARGELVLCWSLVLIVPALVTLLAPAQRFLATKNLFFAGYLFGFSLHFHRSASIFWLIVLGLKVTASLFAKPVKIGMLVRYISVSALGLLLAIAPVLDQANKFLSYSEERVGSNFSLASIASDWLFTLKGFVVPIFLGLHAPYQQLSIFGWPLTIFSIFGLVVCFVYSRSFFLKYCIPLILLAAIVLLTHSALTNSKNNAGRLFVLYPVMVFFVAVCTDALIKLSSRLFSFSTQASLRFAFCFSLLVGLGLGTIPAYAWSIRYRVEELTVAPQKHVVLSVFANAISEARPKFTASHNVCTYSNSPDWVAELALFHIREQISYFSHKIVDMNPARLAQINSTDTFIALGLCGNEFRPELLKVIGQYNKIHFLLQDLD